MDLPVAGIVREIFEKCRELTERTGRPVSPDGHLVGSLGEAYAAEVLHLDLMKPSNLGYDAIDGDGRKVEIKTTTRSQVSLSASGTHADRLIVVKFSSDGIGEIAFDGPAGLAWQLAGPAQKNGQRRVSISTLRRTGVTGACSGDD